MMQRPSTTEWQHPPSDSLRHGSWFLKNNELQIAAMIVGFVVFALLVATIWMRVRKRS